MDSFGLGWRMHCGAEVTESSTNKQQHHHLIKLSLSFSLSPPLTPPPPLLSEVSMDYNLSFVKNCDREWENLQIVVRNLWRLGDWGRYSFFCGKKHFIGLKKYLLKI